MPSVRVAVFVSLLMSMSGFGQTVVPVGTVITPGTVLNAGGTGSSWPVTVPVGATANLNLEQASGWVVDTTFSVSGSNPPALATITPAGGGGSTMVISTAGITNPPGLYSGWMARKGITTVAGQLNMLMRATYNFDSVSGIQAWEIGRRSTNAAQVTDNGQTQLVPIGGNQLELDVVPNGAGAAWTDSGCRFPMFVIGTTYTEDIYYINDTNGAESIMYISLNGTRCLIPSGLQHASGVVQDPPWGANSAVVAFQPDAKPSAAQFNAIVTMNVWTW